MNWIALPLLHTGVVPVVHREALEGKRRVLGPQHPDTLRNVVNLGVTLGNAGDHAAAIPLLREALAGFTIVHGTKHPHTCRCQAELEDNEQFQANPRLAAHHRRQL